jgi:hypothetical protein
MRWVEPESITANDRRTNSSAAGGGGIERRAGPQGVEQAADGRRVGPGLPHAVEIELEVGGVAAVGQFVRLLVEHDLVDEPAGLGVGRGQPGHARAGEPLLHGLEQALEVPDGEHVRLHEPPQPVARVDEPIERMRDEPGAGVAEVDRGAGVGDGRLPGGEG